jgi:hypothetical protein
MATGALSQLDLRIREAVSRELAWDSDVDASAIGVAARRRRYTDRIHRFVCSKTRGRTRRKTSARCASCRQ